MWLILSFFLYFTFLIIVTISCVFSVTISTLVNIIKFVFLISNVLTVSLLSHLVILACYSFWLPVQFSSSFPFGKLSSHSFPITMSILTTFLSFLVTIFKFYGWFMGVYLKSIEIHYYDY